MSSIQAFQQQGKSFTLTASAASQTCPVQVSDLGLTQPPQALRCINNGTADVWISFTNAAGTAAFPVAGTTTVGTPAAGFRLKPGAIEVIQLNAAAANVAGGIVANTSGPGFFINYIGASAGQAVDFSPGEGV